MSYFVYIIYSEKFDRFYTGQTQDCSKRIDRHNRGLEKATAPYSPWKFVCIIEKETRAQAMLLEKKLKNLNREKLAKFIAKYS